MKALNQLTLAPGECFHLVEECTVCLILPFSERQLNRRKILKTTELKNTLCHTFISLCMLPLHPSTLVKIFVEGGELTIHSYILASTVFFCNLLERGLFIPVQKDLWRMPKAALFQKQAARKRAQKRFVHVFTLGNTSITLLLSCVQKGWQTRDNNTAFQYMLESTKYR